MYPFKGAFSCDEIVFFEQGSVEKLVKLFYNVPEYCPDYSFYPASAESRTGWIYRPGKLFFRLVLIIIVENNQLGIDYL